MKDFHSIKEEPKFTGKITMPINDNVRLSIDEYRKLI